MDQFANAAPKQRDEAFREAAAQLELPELIVEKDFWICWSLKQLFKLPTFGDHMIFKGGTSLSKAYDVIYRFSEDVDISLDRRLLGFEGDHDPENPDLSGKKQKQLLQELQDAAKAAVAGPVLAGIKSSVALSLEQDFSLTVHPNDPQTLLFSYPPLRDDLDGYVNPTVRFEFGARGVHLPAEKKQISPYVYQAFPDLMAKGEIDVKVLGIERTFWEKATILHMLYHRNPDKPLSDRMSRHYYDMAQLIKHHAKVRALDGLDLLEQVAHHKSVFFKAAWANYDQAKPGSLRLMPDKALTSALRRDYTGMKEMIIGDAPSFDDILNAINAFEAEVNN